MNLITGMSGTGKSAVIQELASRGYPAHDLDTPEWSERCRPVRWSDTGSRERLGVAGEPRPRTPFWRAREDAVHQRVR